MTIQGAGPQAYPWGCLLPVLRSRSLSSIITHGGVPAARLLSASSFPGPQRGGAAQHSTEPLKERQQLQLEVTVVCSPPLPALGPSSVLCKSHHPELWGPFKSSTGITQVNVTFEDTRRFLEVQQLSTCPVVLNFKYQIKSVNYPKDSLCCQTECTH